MLLPTALLDIYSSALLRELVVQAPRLLEDRQLLRDDVERQRLSARLRAHVVAVAHVDRLAVELLLADNCGRAYTRSTH